MQTIILLLVFALCNHAPRITHHAPMSSSAKGGASGASYDVFGTVAGIICYGQLASLTSIIIDGKAVWEGTQAQAGDSTDFTSVIDPKFFTTDGYFKIYWGTSSQTIDAALSGHPDYKGLAHFVAKNFLFGREKYTAPNVEIIGTRKPVCDTSLCAAIHNIVNDGQVNPVASLGEVFISICGPGWSLAKLDAASWADAAEYCFDNQDLCFCSPLFNAQTDLRSAVAQLLAMFDGIPFRTATGTLGITPRRAGEDPGGLDTIDAALLTDKPKPTFGGWGDVPTGFIVNYTDRAKKFITVPVKKDNGLARLVRGEDHPTTVEYPHITIATQAEAMAAHHVRLNQHPPAKYPLSMRREHATGLLIGSKQKFDSDPETDSAGTTQLGTVEEIRRRRDGITEVTIKADPIAESTPYTPTINPNAQIEATCEPITDAIAIPLPQTITGSEAGVALLAARPQADCIGFKIDYSQDGGDASEIGIQTGFAAKMTLDAAVITSGILLVNLKYQITDNSGGADFTGVGAADNNVGTSFIATATTPAWGTGKLITVSEVILADSGSLISGTLRLGVRYLIENNWDTDFTPIGGPAFNPDDLNLGYSFICTATSGITWGTDETRLRTCTVQKADEVIRLSYADANGFDNYLAERTAETEPNANNDPLLLVLIHKGELGGALFHAPGIPSPDYDLQVEVCSIVSRAAVDADTHDYTVLRARKDLPALDFSPSSNITEAWIVPGKDFVFWTHYKMSQRVLDGDFTAAAPNFFQLTAITAVAEDVSSPIYAGCIFPKQQFRAPKITWSTPASDPHTLSSSSLTPAATIVDYQGDLVRVELFTTRKDTAVQTKRFDVSIPPSDSVTLADLITLSGMTAISDLTQGTTDRYYLITIRAYDAEGNVEESTITMLRLGSGTTKGFSITYSKEGRGFTGSLALTLTRNGTTATEIHYAVVKRGASVPSSYTTVAAATVDLTLINSCRVWARSSDGTTHGQWQYQNYNKRAR